MLSVPVSRRSTGPEERDEHAVDHAEDEPEGDPGGDRARRVEDVPRQEVGDDEGDEPDDGFDRQVDVASDDHERLADGGDADDRRHHRDLRQVGGRQELRRLDRDERAEDEHHGRQAQLAVATGERGDARREALAGDHGRDRGLSHRASP